MEELEIKFWSSKANNGLLGIVQRRRTASGSYIRLLLVSSIGGDIDSTMNKPPDNGASDLAPSLVSTIHSLGDLPASTPPLVHHCSLPERVIIDDTDLYVVYFTLLLYEPID